MELAKILSLERRADDAFEAMPPGDGPLYGGCSAALALAAAARTLSPGFEPKSLHAAFLRAGRWGEPTSLEVERLSEGRNFASRLVSVRQQGRLVASVMASFHVPAPGLDWQGAERGDLPPVELSHPAVLALPDPSFELRCVSEPPDSPTSGSTHPFWSRAATPIGDEALAHALALAYMSDYLVVFALHRTATELPQPESMRTLTHDLWFHRRASADEWLYFDADALSMSEGRGLLSGSITRPDGLLAASYVQEVVIPG